MHLGRVCFICLPGVTRENTAERRFCIRNEKKIQKYGLYMFNFYVSDGTKTNFVLTYRANSLIMRSFHRLFPCYFEHGVFFIQNDGEMAFWCSI